MLSRIGVDGPRGRRQSPEEIKARVLKEAGAVLLDGRPTEVEHGPEVVANKGRIASFLEFNERPSWYCPMGTGTKSGSRLAWTVTDEAPQEVENAPAVITFCAGFAAGSPLPQPTGEFVLKVDGKERVRFRSATYPILWEGEGARLAFDPRRVEVAPRGSGLFLDDVLREESCVAFGVMALRLEPGVVKPGTRPRIEVEGRGGGHTRRLFKLDPATALVRASIGGALELAVRGRRLVRMDDYLIASGDIHTHSGQGQGGRGCGAGSVDENFSYARTAGALELYALSDHDFDMREVGDWEARLEAVERYYEPGRFVTLPAYEWTSPLYGHRVVYYAEPKGTKVFSGCDVVNGSELDTPEELWRRLKAGGVPAITVPHHPMSASHPGNWNHHDPKMEPLVEIYSSWGSCEFPESELAGTGSDWHGHLTAREALARGYRLGFVASSDGHDGHPGNAQSPHVKHHHLYHDLGSGRAGVLVEKFERRDVFEALRSRRCYATTGAPMAMLVRSGATVMGGAREGVSGPLEVSVRVRGTQPIARLDLIMGGRVSRTETGLPRDVDLTWRGVDLPEGPSYFYVRAVQRDRETAWSSPIWVEP